METELVYNGRWELHLTLMFLSPEETVDEDAYEAFVKELKDKGIDFRIEHGSLILFPGEVE